jgi:DNA-binding LacI/PurR family transcriptional regulator
MKTTIYDIAKEANVSIATVSKVINSKGKISAEKRKEVLQVMNRLNYQPSMIATALTGKQTFTLGLLVPDISNPYFAEMARAIEDQGHRTGYSVVICSTDNKDERVENYINLLLKKSVDGIIIGTGVDNQELILHLLNRKIPVALISREMPDIPVHTVVVDDVLGGRLAAEHLLELGHTRIGVLAEDLKVISSRNRVRGFRQALREDGLSFREEDAIICDYQIGLGKQAALELLSSLNRPTALFCCNDLLAIGAIQAAKELGLRVPSELSIVGFDNTILATVTDPQLTTVAQPIEHMGKQAVNLLMQDLEQYQTVKNRIVVQPELIVRQSTGIFSQINI